MRFAVHESESNPSIVVLAIWQTSCPLNNIVIIWQDVVTGLIDRTNLLSKEGRFLYTYAPKANIAVNLSKLQQEYDNWVVANDLKFDPSKCYSCTVLFSLIVSQIGVKGEIWRICSISQKEILRSGCIH